MPLAVEGRNRNTVGSTIGLMADDSRLCDECRAIRDQLVEACRERWAAMDQTTRDASAVRAMIGGTEQDADRALELVSRAKIEDDPRIKTVLLKAFPYKRRTGHPLPFRPPFRLPFPV
jgi:hypothetical protein